MRVPLKLEIRAGWVRVAQTGQGRRKRLGGWEGVGGLLLRNKSNSSTATLGPLAGVGRGRLASRVSPTFVGSRAGRRHCRRHNVAALSRGRGGGGGGHFAFILLILNRVQALHPTSLYLVRVTPLKK